MTKHSKANGKVIVTQPAVKRLLQCTPMRVSASVYMVYAKELMARLATTGTDAAVMRKNAQFDFQSVGSVLGIVAITIERMASTRLCFPSLKVFWRMCRYSRFVLVDTRLTFCNGRGRGTLTALAT